MMVVAKPPPPLLSASSHQCISRRRLCLVLFSANGIKCTGVTESALYEKSVSKLCATQLLRW